MNRWGKLTALFIGLSATAFGQNNPVFQSKEEVFHSGLEKVIFSDEKAPFYKRIMCTDASANDEAIDDFERTFQKNVIRFKKKQTRYRNEQQFVKHLFYTLHRNELKRYDQYVSFARMASAGKYDCLTASTLYAMYLNALNIRTDIVETEYHVYLKVYTKQGEVLLESTDPLEGYITSRDAISNAEANYIAKGGDFRGVANNETDKGRVINSSVSFNELVGLHYYNQAIAAWNNNQVTKARALVLKAYHLYPSDRIESLKKLFAEGNPHLLARGK